MPKIIYVEHSGVEHTITADCGTTLMEAAVDNGVPGIDADCGGACACGTCHVMVDQVWYDRLGERSAEEESMLSLAVEVTASSRLSCQITLTDEMNNIRVNLPASQY